MRLFVKTRSVHRQGHGSLTQLWQDVACISRCNEVTTTNQDGKEKKTVQCPLYSKKKH